jgi:hypothetical protein
MSCAGELEVLSDEERVAELTIQSSADEINQRDHQEIAQVVARAEIERRLREFPAPNFLASFLREKWLGTMTQLYIHEGEESEAWTAALATLDDLVWSVQPKRQTEDRKKLVAMLRNLLKNPRRSCNVTWEAERERFMSSLVGMPRRSSWHRRRCLRWRWPKRQPRLRRRQPRGRHRDRDLRVLPWRDAGTGTGARARAGPVQIAAEVAASLGARHVGRVREDGHLACQAGGVSPLRGTYLFTNRQGQKAVSLTADELAERFRSDRARLVEAAPLVDRAFVSMMAKLEEKFGSDTAPAQAA